MFEEHIYHGRQFEKLQKGWNKGSSKVIWREWFKKTHTKTHTLKEYGEECSKINEMVPQMKTLLGTKQKINPYLITL